MRYQYKMGGLFSDIIEGVIKGGADAYQKNKQDEKAVVEKKRETADKQAESAGKKKEPEGLLDKLTKPVKDAAKQQAKNDITKWALVALGLWLLLKGRK